MHNIFINGRFLSQGITGVQRYAHEILRSFDELIAKNTISPFLYDIVLLVPYSVVEVPSLKHIKIKSVGLLHGHPWEQFELPYYAKNGLLINLCNTGPIIKTDQIVTIHDASVYGFPHAYSFKFRTWYKLLLPLIAQRSSRVITDSKYSKTELIKYCKASDSKVDVISLGCEHLSKTIPDETILKRYDIGDKPYVLAVSSMNLNKNFKGIVDSLQYLQNVEFDIVVAGGANPSVFGSNFKIPSQVKYVGYVTDSELVSLYMHAGCFVYPSFYEGFGFPPLEAMYWGCPVVSSRATSLPEVCGDAALYCDPFDPRDIASKIQTIMTDNLLRNQLKENASKQVLRFSWEQCALQTWNVIEQVIN